MSLTADHLFILDKDGDKKLDGRIVRFHFYNESNESLDVFVAFDDADSYTMFTLQTGVELRLNYVATALLKYFYKENILRKFIQTPDIQVQYEYTFKLYKTQHGSFMVNYGQTKAYLIKEDNILISAKGYSEVDSLKELFWR